MSFFYEQKQSQLIMLFNNFKTRLKKICEKDYRYVELNKQIELNNSKRYDVTKDKLFFTNGMFDQKLFYKAENIVANYVLLERIYKRDLEKARKTFFRRKAKVKACEDKLSILKADFKLYEGSIKKYNINKQIWWNEYGEFFDANKKLIEERNKIFETNLKDYFYKVVKKTPEILLAKQTEISYEDNKIADFLLKQQKGYDMSKIEKDFYKKLHKSLSMFKENNYQQEF